MRPDRLIPYPPRLWKVDIVRSSDRPLAVCRTCGPLDAALAPDQPLQSAVLRHLARHARKDVTPPHLRTCQCGRSGCPWHRRHRGCTGEVVLALTHRPRSPAWQLADACRRCCAATPGTAAVPLMRAAMASRCSAMADGAGATPFEDGDDSQVWESHEAFW